MDVDGGGVVVPPTSSRETEDMLKMAAQFVEQANEQQPQEHGVPTSTLRMHRASLIPEQKLTERQAIVGRLLQSMEAETRDINSTTAKTDTLPPLSPSTDGDRMPVLAKCGTEWWPAHALRAPDDSWLVTFSGWSSKWSKTYPPNSHEGPNATIIIDSSNTIATANGVIELDQPKASVPLQEPNDEDAIVFRGTTMSSPSKRARSTSSPKAKGARLFRWFGRKQNRQQSEDILLETPQMRPTASWPGDDPMQLDDTFQQQIEDFSLAQRVRDLLSKYHRMQDEQFVTTIVRLMRARASKTALLEASEMYMMSDSCAFVADLTNSPNTPKSSGWVSRLSSGNRASGSSMAVAAQYQKKNGK